jgi:hypothetical protein
VHCTNASVTVVVTVPDDTVAVVVVVLKLRETSDPDHHGVRAIQTLRPWSLQNCKRVSFSFAFQLKSRLTHIVFQSQLELRPWWCCTWS